MHADVQMWELDHKEGWARKNWWFQIVVLEKTLESPLDSKEVKPVNRKGNQPWIFIGRIDAESETPILWPPNVKSQLTGKDLDAGKDWRQKEKRTAENEMVRQCQPTQRTWTWANSMRRWRREAPGMLQSTEWCRVRHDWATEPQQRLWQLLVDGECSWDFLENLSQHFPRCRTQNTMFAPISPHLDEQWRT